MNKPSTLTLRLSGEEAEQLEDLKRITGKKTGSEVLKFLMREYADLKKAYEREKSECKAIKGKYEEHQEIATNFATALEDFIKLAKK